MCNQLGSPSSSIIANHPENSNLRLVPWGGVAAIIPTDTAQNYQNYSGKAFCFLPLPVETNLPVNVCYTLTMWLHII